MKEKQRQKKQTNKGKKRKKKQKKNEELQSSPRMYRVSETAINIQPNILTANLSLARLLLLRFLKTIHQLSYHHLPVMS